VDRLEGRQDLHVQPRAQHPLARRPSVSSADVKFTYDEILLKLHPRTRTLTDVIERISAPSKNVVVFRLKQRYAPFLTWLDEDNGAILPRHLCRGTDPLTNPVNLRPVGTGPFKFESYSPGDRVVLVRNPTYFKEGLPRLDRLVFRNMQSAQAAQAFEAGEVDLYMFPSGPDALRFLNRPGITVVEAVLGECREAQHAPIRFIFLEDAAGEVVLVPACHHENDGTCGLETGQRDASPPIPGAGALLLALAVIRVAPQPRSHEPCSSVATRGCRCRCSPTENNLENPVVAGYWRSGRVPSDGRQRAHCYGDDEARLTSTWMTMPG